MSKEIIKTVKNNIDTYQILKRRIDRIEIVLNKIIRTLSKIKSANKNIRADIIDLNTSITKTKYIK